MSMEKIIIETFKMYLEDSSVFEDIDKLQMLDTINGYLKGVTDDPVLFIDKKTGKHVTTDQKHKNDPDYIPLYIK
jgi:hypothetical protein